MLDICIAVITALGLLNTGNEQHFLVPIDYLLTIVVVLSVALFIVLLALRATEKQEERENPSTESTRGEKLD